MCVGSSCAACWQLPGILSALPVSRSYPSTTMLAGLEAPRLYSIEMCDSVFRAFSYSLVPPYVPYTFLSLLLPLWQFVLEVLGDGAIKKYGRADLYEVFLAINPLTLVKACESSRVYFGGASAPVWYLPPLTSPRGVRRGIV